MKRGSLSEVDWFSCDCIGVLPSKHLSDTGTVGPETRKKLTSKKKIISSPVLAKKSLKYFIEMEIRKKDYWRAQKFH